MTFRTCIVAFLLCIGSPFVATGEDSKSSFDRNIAPLLAKRCLGCHSGSEPKGGLDLSRREAALKGGDTGRALVAAKPDKSLLWKRVAAGEMPPKKPLPPGERRLLRSWIAGGAKWGTSPIDPFRFTSDSRAGYDWWSLQSVRRPPVPRAAWGRNPIDAFTHRGLAQNGLTPSEEADRRTLIRRLTFDLTGLPPTPEEVAAFLQDTSPDASERLVDRLLASPRYGERWGRHWLDIVRFGESQGFERDKLRTNSWRYRDWVIGAFNDDMPYDRFAKWQLAGDALRPGDARAIIATGFLVAGPYDEVGQNQQSKAMRAVVRQDELEDLVSVTGQTFLGLTIHCARCHDHKFDPIRQVEYYRLTASLAGVRHGTRNIGSLPIRREARERQAALQSRIAVLQRRIASVSDGIRAKLRAERSKQNRKPVAVPNPIAAWDFRKSLNDAKGGLSLKPHGAASRDSTGLRLDGKSAFVTSPPLKKALKSKTLEAWVRLDSLSQRGGGVIGVQTLDGSVFDAIVFGEREPQRWMAGSDFFRRTKSFTGPAEAASADKTVHVAITYSEDGTISGYRNGRPYGKSYKTIPARFSAEKSQLIFGLRHSPPSRNKMFAGRIIKARLYDRTLSHREIAASAGVAADYVTDEEVARHLSDVDRRRMERWRFEIAQLQSCLKRWTGPSTYAVAPRPPEQSFLLLRGNPAQKSRVVNPGGVAALSGVSEDFNLTGEASDANRRMKLADWITDRKNPLLARVIVNRLWHYHFGLGLVNTPSDFGFNGGRPSHPELLDWLASELIRHDFRLKPIQRLIVSSATYRQSSEFRKEAAAIDAGNRFLWRMSPRRLEAEAVRDAILTVAGRLNGAMGGPGFQDFTTFVRNTQFYEMRDPVGHSFNRRSVYRTWVRSGRNRFLDAFDCPDPSTKTPKRAVTITPLQALSLLNNSFVLRMSDRFANRLKREFSKDAEKRVDRAWQLAFGRHPDADEQKQASAFVSKHGLPALCRVLFNANEFLVVD